MCIRDRIYPHVVGNSVGLPSIWVLVAVTLGGKLMGVMGMLIFIPLCSVAYAIFRAYIKEQLDIKKIYPEVMNEDVYKRQEQDILLPLQLIHLFLH